MEMNVKKMVAREVLILLCLFIVIGACGYAVSTLPSKCQGVFQVKYNKRIHQITSYDYNLLLSIFQNWTLDDLKVDT